MKRLFILVSLMLVLAACGSQSKPGPSADQSSGPTGGQTSGNRSDNPSASYSAVSGQIVDHLTGQPYPNAYVRFAWLVDANNEKEIHTVTDASGRYEIQLPAGQYQVTAGDACDLNAGFAIIGRTPDDIMITVPGTATVDFVEYPITPGADIPGAC